jgi:hypothetical protein
MNVPWSVNPVGPSCGAVVMVKQVVDLCEDLQPLL